MLIKYDALSVEAMDKIHACIDLLCDAGLVERKATLKETYESVVGIYNLERDNPDMWRMVWNHEIFSLFQMEKQSGIQGISLIKPKSVDELAVLNSVIRLMAPEKGAEQPLNTWARYRKNIELWYNEMRRYGLTEDEIMWLNNNKMIQDGMCISQEGLMSLVQEERLGGHTLNFADKCRKGLAKKIGSLFDECEKEFFEVAEQKHLSDRLTHYVWDVLLRVQRGYSFNSSHTLAYSLVGLQEMNLAYRFPIIYWNCACLIVDSGGTESEDDEEDIYVEDYEDSIEYEVEDFNDGAADDEEQDEESEETTTKKKTKTTNYGKVATAIGKMKSEGISIVPPNINNSIYTFSPDEKNNSIIFGFSGITRIGEDLIKEIIANQPYTSLEDFLSRIKITKPQIINLIKSGAFDIFGSRVQLMEKYIDSISDKKTRLTLQNMAKLIEYNLLPTDFTHNIKVYNFNKYLKKFKDEDYYILDENAQRFYNDNYDIDKLVFEGDKTCILQKNWNKIYKEEMNPVRAYIKDNQESLLFNINKRARREMWDKYVEDGYSIESWEMDSVSCYFNKHELDDVDLEKYGIVDYFKLPDKPEVESSFYKAGKQIPLFKIHRIAGTVLDRDKNKKSVTLLTKTGVVTVKIYGDAFTKYDRQLSEKLPTGKKKIIEKSWFQRGNLIVVTGIKRDEMFFCKKYARTPYHLVERIRINPDKTLEFSGGRDE